MFWVGCLIGSCVTCIGYMIIAVINNRKQNKNKDNKKGE